MKRIFLMAIFALVCGILLSNCGKETDVNEIEGTYVGTYTWTYLTNDVSSNSTPTIELKDGKYTYKGLSNGSYYDSGYGNFIIEGNKLIFELTYHDIPMEDIGVINSWLLKGEYKYKLDGNKLIFSKTVSNSDGRFHYEFDVKREASR